MKLVFEELTDEAASPGSPYTLESHGNQVIFHPKITINYIMNLGEFIVLIFSVKNKLK